MPAGGSRTLWVAVAGSDKGPAPRAARARRPPSTTRPRSSRPRSPSASAGAASPGSSLPGDQRLEAGRRLGQAEHPRSHPGRRGPADPLDRPGQAVPAARGHGRARPLGGRRLPRLSVDVRAPTASTPRSRASRSASSRRSRTTCARCATISDILNDRSGGRDARGDLGRLDLVRQGLAPLDPATGEVKYDFNTDETAKFPSAVALLWRWTGDNGFRDAHVRLLQAQPALRRGAPRRGRRRLAGGTRQRRARRHGRREARQLGLPDPRAVRPRRHGALEERRRAPTPGRGTSRGRLHDRFEATWWMAAVPQHADSIDDPPVGGPTTSSRTSTGSA